MTTMLCPKEYQAFLINELQDIRRFANESRLRYPKGLDYPSIDEPMVLYYLGRFHGAMWSKYSPSCKSLREETVLMEGFRNEANFLLGNYLKSEEGKAE